MGTPDLSVIIIIIIERKGSQYLMLAQILQMILLTLLSTKSLLRLLMSKTPASCDTLLIDLKIKINMIVLHRQFEFVHVVSSKCGCSSENDT